MRKLTKTEKNILQYVFLLFLIGLTVYIVSTTIDYRRIPDVIAFVDKKFLFFGMLLVLIYIILETLVFQLIINSVEKDKKKRTIGLQMGTMGLYYNLVTPFASGSQPMQIYVMNRYGISLSKAVAIVTNKTVLFQTVVTFICGAVILLNKSMIVSDYRHIIMLLTFGMAMNMVTILGGMMIVLNPKLMKKFVDIVISALGRFRIFKFLRDKNERCYNYIDDFNKSILMYIKDIKSLIITIFLTFLQLFIYFSIVFCIYKASKLSGTSFYMLFSLQVLLYMTISPIPTPGNVGANEITFFGIFNRVFPKRYIGYAVIMYSFLVYYFILLLSGICTWISHYYMNKMDEDELRNIKKESQKIKESLE
ncbi:lysylphosphatidylglycerol synthase transmembrane domain-containing protein [Peptacetobacter sp.]|uniref:lysylphosphatidylglycerol synthase transmembrane domain-containing protein n=1 Tax=Peptacetobacter sp. TaxID=2991975 RepID=UPI002623900B|nr:lysylphosphatidylglycerol synthase transmembrane domain-containing protein [Peptacetobacter sp.]